MDFIILISYHWISQTDQRILMSWVMPIIMPHSDVLLGILMDKNKTIFHMVLFLEVWKMVHSLYGMQAK